MCQEVSLQSRTDELYPIFSFTKVLRFLIYDRIFPGTTYMFQVLHISDLRFGKSVTRLDSVPILQTLVIVLCARRFDCSDALEGLNDEFDISVMNFPNFVFMAFYT